MLTDLTKKEAAIDLRKQGKSIRDIEKTLKISRSTLSGWLKNIELTKEQQEKLLEDWKNGLVNARKKAAEWHIEDGNKRKNALKKDVDSFFSELNIDGSVKELLLAAFYLAEGTKKENCFVFANSNPEILNTVIRLIRSIYKIDESKIRCCLHLRRDQDEEELKNFWSETLNISRDKFLKSQFDKRTIKKTYNHYKGVCVLMYYDMALQRRLLYIGENLLKII